MIISMLVLIIFVPMTYAKYISTEKINSKTGIAKPIFTFEGNEVIEISETNNIGYYEFSIKNFNETEVSETGFLYTIEIVCNDEEAIGFELYNEDEQIALDDLKTEQISIIGNEKVEQKYKLKVTYDVSKGAKEDIFGDVQVRVLSEQAFF